MKRRRNPLGDAKVNLLLGLLYLLWAWLDLSRARRLWRRDRADLALARENTELLTERVSFERARAESERARGDRLADDLVTAAARTWPAVPDEPELADE